MDRYALNPSSTQVFDMMNDESLANFFEIAKFKNISKEDVLNLSKVSDNILDKSLFYWMTVLETLIYNSNNDEDVSSMREEVCLLLDNLFKSNTVNEVVDILLEGTETSIKSIIEKINRQPRIITDQFFIHETSLSNTEILNCLDITQSVTLNKTLSITNFDDIMPATNEPGVPIITISDRKELAQIFNMLPSDIWYPFDLEDLQNIRAVLWLALNTYGIVAINPDIADNNTFIDYESLPLGSFCGYLISKIPKLTDRDSDIIQHFKKVFTNDRTVLGNFIFNLVSSLDGADKTKLRMLDKEIIRNLAKLMEPLKSANMIADIIPDKGNLPTKISNFDTSNLTLCSSIVTPVLLLDILSKYPTLKNGSNVINLDVCPIVAKTILTIFKYFRGKEIIIDNNIINLVPVDDDYLKISNNPYNTKEFTRLKRAVKFNNDYQNFQTLLKQSTLHKNDILSMLPIIYNMGGLSCSVIASELYSIYFNINTNSQLMYNLLSQLTPFDIQNLDNDLKNECVLENIKISPLELIMEPSNLHPIHVKKPICLDRITTVINDMSALKDKITSDMTMFISKVNIASQTNFTEYEILSYWLDFDSLDDDKLENLYLLYLYSNTSNAVKRWLFQTLKFKSIDLYNNKKFTYNEILNTEPLINIESVSEFYTRLINENYNVINCLPDLAEYYKQTKDESIITVLQILQDTIEVNVCSRHEAN